MNCREIGLKNKHIQLVSTGILYSPFTHSVYCMITYIGDYMRIIFLHFFFSKSLAVDTEKIAFKVVQIKSLALHIADQKLSFYIFMVGHLKNIFMEHDLYLIY